MAFQSKHSWDRACPSSDGSDGATYYKSYDPSPRMAAPRWHITLAVCSRSSPQYKRSWTTLEFIIILRSVCFEMPPPPQSLFGSDGDDNLLIRMLNLNERVFR